MLRYLHHLEQHQVGGRGRTPLTRKWDLNCFDYHSSLQRRISSEVYCCRPQSRGFQEKQMTFPNKNEVCADGTREIKLSWHQSYKICKEILVKWIQIRI